MYPFFCGIHLNVSFAGFPTTKGRRGNSYYTSPLSHVSAGNLEMLAMKFIPGIAVQFRSMPRSTSDTIVPRSREERQLHD